MFCDNLWRDPQPQADYRRSEVDANKLKTSLAWLSAQPVEHMLVAFYNPRNHLIAIEEIARGGRHMVSFDVEDIFRRCVMLSAKSFIAIHNHPEGGAEPSRQDIVFTERMISRGASLDIHMLDSLIVDDQGTCRSLRQTKAIDPWYAPRPWAHHGPAIARALLTIEQSIADQADAIQPYLQGSGMKLLFALYLQQTGQLLQELSLATGLGRATAARALKGLLQVNLVASISPAAKPRLQRYRLTDDGYNITECLLTGGEARRPMLVPA